MNWEEMSGMVKKMWAEHTEEFDRNIKQEMKYNIRSHAPSSVFAFWSLSDWKSFKTYTTILDPVKNPYEQSFFSAVLLIK